MTIAAVDTQTGNMVLVAEGHRLLGGDIDPRPEIRTRVGIKSRPDPDGGGWNADYNRFCDRIRAPFEKLCHAKSLRCRPF